MSTTVVNVKTCRDFDPVKNANDVYIGRANKYRGWKASKWANPFRIGEGCTREESIEKYRFCLQNTPELLEQLGELQGKRLGCWCKDEACHGDVLVELLEGMMAKEIEHELANCRLCGGEFMRDARARFPVVLCDTCKENGACFNCGSFCTADDYCYGCGYHICEGCIGDDAPWGDHDPTDHGNDEEYTRID